jgi:hypothetical protein
MSSTTIDLNILPVSLALEISDPDITIENPAPFSISLGAVMGPRGPEGQVGPQGIQGIQGPPGAAGSAPQAYEHEESPASATWVITHNLGYRPAGILVFDTAGSEWVPGVVTHNSVNQLVLQWSAAFSGVAYLS